MTPYYYRAELCGKIGKNGKRRDPIIDGDTLDCLTDLGWSIKIHLRLRLLGVDTPESRTRNLQEKAQGLRAKAFLKKTLESADEIEFESHEKGKYGRVLATVYAVSNGRRTNINELLIREGHARRYTGGKREPWGLVAHP